MLSDVYLMSRPGTLRIGLFRRFANDERWIVAAVEEIKSRRESLVLEQDNGQLVNEENGLCLRLSDCLFTADLVTSVVCWTEKLKHTKQSRPFTHVLCNYT